MFPSYFKIDMAPVRKNYIVAVNLIEIDLLKIGCYI